MAHLLIFEGAELTGKSYLISQIYDYIEKRHHTNPHILNGCHWFNCDVGVFGDRYGRPCIEKYLEMAETMVDRNVIFEKFHITDAVYHQLYKDSIINYGDVEERLTALGARLVFCRVTPREEIFARRLTDRLALYPHYHRIAKQPADYLAQQKLYQKLIAQSRLPTLTVDTTHLPNPDVAKKIIDWIQ